LRVTWKEENTTRTEYLHVDDGGILTTTPNSELATLFAASRQGNAHYITIWNGVYQGRYLGNTNSNGKLGAYFWASAEYWKLVHGLLMAITGYFRGNHVFIQQGNFYLYDDDNNNSNTFEVTVSID